MTVNDASLGESGSKLSKVAATSLLMGVTRASSEAYTTIANELWDVQQTKGTAIPRLGESAVPSRITTKSSPIIIRSDNDSIMICFRYICLNL